VKLFGTEIPPATEKLLELAGQTTETASEGGHIRIETLLYPNEVADYIGITSSMVERGVRNGAIPTTLLRSLSDRTLMYLDELDNWMRCLEGKATRKQWKNELRAKAVQIAQRRIADRAMKREASECAMAKTEYDVLARDSYNPITGKTR